MSKDPLISRACVHFGTHMHHVAKGHCRDASGYIREKVKDEIARTSNATPTAISLFIGRDLLMQGLIDKEDVGKVFSEGELNFVFKK